MPGCTRRRAIVAFAATALEALMPSSSPAAVASPGSRSLAFAHLHTGESLAVEYCSRGVLVPDALAAINRLLRDFRTGDVHHIDPALLDLLVDLHARTGATRPFQVISGYRSPMTNALLRRRSLAVAASSLHMQGRAIDIRVAGVPLVRLRQAAHSLGRGGVGFYPVSDFVHVDTGRVRAW